MTTVVSIDGMSSDDIDIRQNLYETFIRMSLAPDGTYVTINGIKYLMTSKTTIIDGMVSWTVDAEL